MKIEVLKDTIHNFSKEKKKIYQTYTDRQTNESSLHQEHLKYSECIL